VMGKRWHLLSLATTKNTMDRNSIIGLLLIGMLVIGYSIYTQPSAEQLRQEQATRDSIASLESKAITVKQPQSDQNKTLSDSAKIESNLSDSVKIALEKEKWGDFYSASEGKEELITLENSKLKVVVSSKGGKIRKAELKDYKTWDGKPVNLMNSDSSVFNLAFSAGNKVINTSSLFFEVKPTTGSSNSATFQVNAGEGRYLEFNYTLAADSYLLNFSIKTVGLQDIISQNATYLNLDWKEALTRQEKSIESERMVSTVYYRFTDDDVDYITESKDEKQSLKTKVKWISFKQHFFNTTLISDQSFDSPVVESMSDKESAEVVKTMSASIALPYGHQQEQTYGMRLYIGPNHYQTLKSIDGLELEKLIPLGWGIFGWVNKFLVIPTFNYLNSFNFNYGIIILLLTVLVRILILPLTFGSFKSQAKMKVLQPELKELNEKYGDDPMKKQQETMNLYRRAGVNPLGGCIPGLLQLPILIAMFRFFPSSIELRQQHFLWAHDLSTYDSILDLPFKIPFYGDHVSLFTLLMTVSTLIYTRMNMQMSAAMNPQMKWMMYLMPIMFLGFFNSYAAGLSYYYFLSNIFGFGQQYLFKAFTNEEEIHRKIQENKKKPVKKSAFQQRLEQMAKDRGIQPPKR
jgi:YidC/Oxa1 family membrane protein insertase